MYKFIKQQLFEFDNHALERILKILSAVALLVILYAFIFSGFQIVDEFEHLHAAWLISVGKVPYVDFFEHHNPLLWYLSAPIVSAFYDDIIIFYIMRGFGFVCSTITLWYIYRIALFFGNKASAWLAVSLTLCNLVTIYNFSQFRPDNYMNLCFIMGLYYWFCYLQRNFLKYLIYSFLAFTFSALFLQKISLLLFVVELIILFLLYKKKMRIKPTAYAALPALGIIFLFIGFLYSHGMLLEYIEFNIYFNQALVSYFERGAFWYNYLLLSIYGLALIVSVYLFRQENLYFKILAVIYIAEFALRQFYFAPHPHYYTLLTMLAALVLSATVKLLMPQYKCICISLIIGLFIYLGHIFNRIVLTSEKHNSYTHYQMAKYIHENSLPHDLLMNGYDKNFNIYRYDVSYYWFGLDMLLPVMEKEYGIQNKLDVNDLILRYQPKFIYAQDYIDLMALRTYGEHRYSQQFIPQIIFSLYKNTPFEKLMLLK